MQRSASVSRFSLESSDCPSVPASPKPLGKLSKLLGLKSDPSTLMANGKYHTTPLQPNNTRSMAFDLPLTKSASFRSRPRNATNDNPRPLSNAPHHRNLSHSVSTPTMHTSTLRPKRTPSMKAFSSSVFDGLSKTNNEPHLVPIRRQLEISADVPQLNSEKKFKWTWKGRVLIPKHFRSSSPTTKENDVEEAPSDSDVTDVSAPQCFPSEAQILDIRPLSDPSSSTLHDFSLTPISTRSSEQEQPTGHKPQRSRGSINKVSRTLGFPEITFATEFGEVPLSASYNSYNPFDSVDVYPVQKQTSAKLSRRLSLTLSTLTTIPTLFRPSSVTRRTSPASRSQTSLSTIDADDIHQFGLADDLSDTWGKISDSRTSSSDPVSPITFHIPPEIPPSSSPGKLKLPDQGEVSPPFPTLTCGRSQSLSSLQVRQVARTASRPDTPFDKRTSTVTKIVRSGSNSPPIAPELRSADHTSLQPSTKTWNGQWNQDDMQDVIKKLRCLK